MAGQPNLNDGNFRDFDRRLRKLEAGAPMNNAAIGRSGMEVYDGGAINISNGSFYLNGYGSVAGTLAVSGTLPVTGGLIVSGTERITGSWFLDGVGEVAGTMTITGGLIVEGEQRVSGSLEITGDLTVTGPTHLDGKTDIGGDTTVDGTLDIKGKSTLQNDLTVQGGGKIKVGANMTLTPATGGGSVEFANGASVSSSGTDLKMNATGAALSLGTQAVMTGGTSTVVVAGSSTSLNTPLAIISARMQARGIRQAPAGAESNLRWDPASGEIMYIP